jgi:hypothetical protein
MRELSHMPVVLKGILTAEDAGWPSSMVAGIVVWVTVVASSIGRWQRSTHFLTSSMPLAIGQVTSTAVLGGRGR